MQTSSHTAAELDRILDGAKLSHTSASSDDSASAICVTRAVIVTGERESFDPAMFPAALATIVDKPFVQHVIESLIRQGITEFDVVPGTQPEKIEALLGHGSRWGTSIRFHLPGPAGSACQIIRRMFADDESPVVFVSGERFYPGSISLLTADGTRLPAAYTLQGVGCEWAGRRTRKRTRRAGVHKELNGSRIVAADGLSFARPHDRGGSLARCDHGSATARNATTRAEW